MGLLLGCGLAFLAEVFDKSFRSLEDVRQRLQLPIVGQVPHLKDVKPDDQTAFHPHLVTVHRPRSVEAESYRGLRTSLFFSTLTSGRSLIQVTSSVEGEGKTTLTSNLAVSIAQSDKRVLLIDADLRRPRVNEVFGLSNDVGLVSIIVGQVEIVDAIRKDVVPNLDVITAGPIPPNPADLLTSPRLKDILAVLREKYDFVLVDTPPVLIVSDPSIVAPNVDGLILVLRLTRTARPIVVRAKEFLDTLGVNILGVALNAVDRKDSFSAYYAQYGYGYVDGYHDMEAEEGGPDNKDSASSGEHLTPNP
jgi:capsular exopolysaccharide synthesis family protein